MSQHSLFSGDRVVEVDIAERMEQAFLDYSMSVIVGRALPDVRDGLKPVQRRILYAMAEAGLRPDRQARKCAAVIGDVMKKYHPHGDASIYDALVRMAQDFAMREPLIDGHGNFGSVDGDAAAAHRYTEARLAQIALALLDGIDEGTVDFVPNYDGFETEPLVLPARLPNLLVNGASGIAVGMATNIPPHNLGEVVDACLLLLRSGEATTDDLMALIPAPDFPTGARILDTEGIADAYRAGRGAVTVEAVATTETRTGGLPRIVVTEIPYQVNKALLLERMAALVKDRKVEAIRDLRDESSRDGMRIVIELKRGEDPAQVLEQLYRLTDLRVNFNVNFVALVGGQPRTLGLREALAAYLAHQREVVTRRTRHRRDKAAARVHVLEGLLAALDQLDAVIALIRGAPSADAARTQLMGRFDLTDAQATAILELQLRRLAALERRRLADEHRDLVVLIAQLDAVLADPGRLDALVAGELTELRAAHASPRRSRLATPAGVAGEDGAPARPLLDAQPVTVYVTAGGWLKPVPQRPASTPHTQPRDPVVAVVRARTDETLLLVDERGGGYRIALADVPVTTMRQRGVTLASLLGEDGGQPPLIGAVPLRGAAGVLTVSAHGLVKRTERAEYEGRNRAMIAAGVRPDDALAAVAACDEAGEVLLAHDGGQCIRFAVADIRLTGRSASGVAGIVVPPGSRVVALSVIAPGEEDRQVLTLQRHGWGLRAPLAEFPRQGRGGKGVRCAVAPVAWCGIETDLHLVSRGEPIVLRGSQAPVGRRAGRTAPVTAAIDGTVVPES